MAFEVEFWPGHIKKVSAEECAEHGIFEAEDALLHVLDEHRNHGSGGWPGGCERMVHGTHFQVWVRKGLGK